MTGASELKNYFYRLYVTLLERHILSPSLIPTTEEEDCVKAFCVLTYAALEEFFEVLTKETLHNAYLKYKSKTIVSKLPKDQDQLDKINLGIVQLLETLILSTSFSIYSGEKSDTLKAYKSKLERVTDIYKSGNNPTIAELTELTKKTDSYTKELIKETEKFFLAHIQSNHGASLKYLLRLLIPVGIDIPNSVLLNSLQKLAEYRGSYAHGYGFSEILSPSDVANYAKDIIQLCYLIQRSLDDFNNI